MPEHDEQKEYFDWIGRNVEKYPKLSLAFAIPNGAKLPFKTTVNRFGKKSRFCPQAKWLLEEGLRPGVPDVFFAFPEHGFHGLFIEFKFGKNKLSPEQKSWQFRLQTQGYAWALAYSWVQAAELTIDYLEGKFALNGSDVQKVA